MPIGTVDYTSTAPWNDPYNPWPLYSQVSLSASDINLVDGTPEPVILTLTEFDPSGGGTVNYTNLGVENIILFWIAYGWLIMYEGDDYFQLNTSTRAIPAGYLQGNVNWEPVFGGVDVTTLSIIPVTTSLNPWEYRRRRLLEIC